jgi:SAM-dependent methyltransferase
MKNNCKVCNSPTLDCFRKEFQIFGEATYKKCTNCNFLYSNHIEISHQSVISEYYKSQSFENEDPGYRARARTALSSLLKFCKTLRMDPVNISLLDYGCGNGEFIILCKKLGIKVTGFEPFYVDKNSDVHPNIINKEEYLDKLKGTFDIVCCFEVVEHATTPKIFENLLGFLNPNGHLFFSTGMYIHDLHTSNWEYIAPAHCSIYSVRSLEILSNKLCITSKYIIREPFADIKYMLSGEIWANKKITTMHSFKSAHLMKLDKIYWSLFYLFRGFFYKMLWRVIYK